MSEFSSIGHLGPEDRPGNRFYLNAGEESFRDSAVLAEAWESLVDGAQHRPEAVSRVVLRGIVNDAVLEELRKGPYSGLLEAAVPLGEELGRPDNNLIYLGSNSPDRQPLVPVERIVEATGEPPEIKKSPEQRVHDSLLAGNTVTTTIAPEDYDSLYELWGRTFGWTHEPGDDQIADLADRLQKDQALPASERSIWFAAVKKDGQIVGAAMAERLPLQGTDGPIDLVESTEWAARKGHGGNGHAPTALAVLNAQILRDLAESPNGQPLIFAECNFMNRADLTGSKAGMAIPSRRYANQVLPQNVEVVDGKEPAGYRDFNLMILPREAQQSYYGPRQIESILAMVNS